MFIIRLTLKRGGIFTVVCVNFTEATGFEENINLNVFTSDH